MTIRWAIRDRLFYAVFGVAVFLLLLIPLLSSFSMRQVQELAITLALSFNSLFLLILGLLLGTSSFWREIERKYTHAVLSLPMSRGVFLLGKFSGLAVFLIFCAVLLGLVAALTVFLAAASYPGENAIAWDVFVLAIIADTLKAILVAAIAILISSVATSFYMPFFVTSSIYLAGSASQEVYDYLHGASVEKYSPAMNLFMDGLYYLLPNFTAFNFKVYAIYSLYPPLEQIVLSLFYFFLYLCIVIMLAFFVFSRREFS